MNYSGDLRVLDSTWQQYPGERGLVELLTFQVIEHRQKLVDEIRHQKQISIDNYFSLCRTGFASLLYPFFTTTN